MKELLEHILSSMFNNPEIVVSEEEFEGRTTLSIHAPKDELGKIIGKGGKVINSVKQLIKVVAIKENKHVELQVVENE